jgi:hypothetical protein
MVMVRTIFAQDVEEIPTASIIAGEDGVELPQELSAGLVTITFENNTEMPFSPVIARLNEGKTMDDFMTAMQQPGSTPMQEVFNTIGGVEVAPQSSSDITYDLSAGNYLYLNFATGGPPEIKPFMVAEAASEPLEAPEADQVITMVDFAFSIPAELETGEQIWEVVNEGDQFHEMRIMRVDEGTTLEEATDMLMEVIMAATQGPPQFPNETVLNFTPMGTGLTAWFDVDLEPGTYLAVCFVPDFSVEGGPPISHLAHGMISLITVTE